ncbi:MAG: sodium-independent anion transporter [Porticoccaceae bacterium]|nr:MAG: sodium-independent anion transporter [Porticoccaceae bacterium]
MKLAQILPCIIWVREYRRSYFVSDMIAAAIVTIMLIPQSLAYALLIGLPAHVGFYASILPLIIYAVFGSSRTLSVGPVAVASLMTASVIQDIASQGSIDHLNAAIILALLSGLLLVLLGIFRFGFLANFLSHPVVSGFITASGIIIAFSQFKHILGITANGNNLPEILSTLYENVAHTNQSTLMIGSGALFFLFWARSGLKKLLLKLKVENATAELLTKTAPVIVVVVTIFTAFSFDLGSKGVGLVGNIPSGLPTIQLPSINSVPWMDLLVPAILISIIGYVESISVGKTLAVKRGQKIDPDQELIGLGAANVASALSGGFPVAGGFSRSVVNFDAGAKTQAAGFFAAIGIGIAALTLTGLLAFLPKATLAATIIVAVLRLVDFSILKRTWKYSLSDFMAVAATMVLTLFLGVEMGVLCGVTASIALHLYKTSRPHIAEVGEIDGTEHFRNVKRHLVNTHTEILSLRLDESLYFANASFLEDRIYKELALRKELKHIILMCTAINEIDISALDVLGVINQRLTEVGVGFHLSEVKGPVMDSLEKTDFIACLNGQIFLSQHIAVTTILENKLNIAQDNSEFRDYQI